LACDAANALFLNPDDTIIDAVVDDPTAK